jgi:hypothetical protein
MLNFEELKTVDKIVAKFCEYLYILVHYNMVVNNNL